MSQSYLEEGLTSKTLVFYKFLWVIQIIYIYFLYSCSLERPTQSKIVFDQSFSMYLCKVLAFFFAFPPPEPAGLADFWGFLELLSSFLGGYRKSKFKLTNWFKTKHCILRLLIILGAFSPSCQWRTSTRWTLTTAEVDFTSIFATARVWTNWNPFNLYLTKRKTQEEQHYYSNTKW